MAAHHTPEQARAFVDSRLRSTLRFVEANDLAGWIVAVKAEIEAMSDLTDGLDNESLDLVIDAIESWRKGQEFGFMLENLT